MCEYSQVRIYLLYKCGLGLCRVFCVCTILTGHVNMTNECRGVLLVASYMCPLRTQVSMTVDCPLGRVPPPQVRYRPRRVPGLPIRDCARSCNNCGHTRPQMNTIDVSRKILFDRLYLVSGMSTFGPWVNYPYSPTTPTVHSTTISRFLCIFFPRMAPHFFGHHDSPSNLAKSRYPPPESAFNWHGASAGHNLFILLTISGASLMLYVKPWQQPWPCQSPVALPWVL